MIRILVMLLAFSGNLYVADPQIETLSDTEFAFDLDGSRISIEIRDRVLLEKKDMLLDWVLYSANTVAHYYARFPVQSVHIKLQVTGGYAVRFGQAFGGEFAFATRRNRRRHQPRDVTQGLDPGARNGAPGDGRCTRVSIAGYSKVSPPMSSRLRVHSAAT